MIEIVVLVMAGLGAGALNAIAGGGTFLSFPALVWAGVPPIVANATATFAALPGYATSAWAYRDQIDVDGRPSLAQIIATAIIGGLIGAFLLLVTPEELFAWVVPWLLLVATATFAVGPSLMRRMTKSGWKLSDRSGLGFLLGVSIYGGYFNGGLGIMLLATLGILGMTNLHKMNGLKNLISVVLSVVSVLTYTAAGLIDWYGLSIVGVSCAIGGYVGANVARRIRNVALLRGFIVAVGLTMTAVFFAQTYG